MIVASKGRNLKAKSISKMKNNLFNENVQAHPRLCSGSVSVISLSVGIEGESLGDRTERP